MYFVKMYFKNNSVLSFDHDTDLYGIEALYELVTEFERIYETSFLGLTFDVVELPFPEEKNEA